MPLQTSLTVDSSDADRILARLRRIPTTVRGRLQEAANDLLVRMQVQGQPSHPYLPWATDTQRVAWFATDGFTLPLGPHTRPKGHKNMHDHYVRDDSRYVNGWTVEEYGDLGFVVENPLPSAIYVAGDATGQIPQTSIHQGRWPLFYKQIQIVYRSLPKLIRDAIERYLGYD